MSMDNWCNDIDTEKEQCSEKILSQFQIAHYKFHMDWLGSNSGLCGERPANNSLITAQACEIFEIP
jgi:hypothetical protein